MNIKIHLALKKHGKFDGQILPHLRHFDSLIHSLIYPFILLSVLRQFRSIFQNVLPTDCDLVLPLSVSSNLCFPEGHPVAAYVLFLTSIISSIFPLTICFRMQFLWKVWPNKLAFLLFIVFRIFISSLTLCNSSFLTWSVQLNSTLLQHHISKLSRYVSKRETN